jgi:hypothetical protein
MLNDGPSLDAASESSSSSSSSLSLPEKIEILYASETGNAQDTAERVGREIRRRGGRCTVQSMKHFNIVSGESYIVRSEWNPEAANITTAGTFTSYSSCHSYHLHSWSG